MSLFRDIVSWWKESGFMRDVNGQTVEIRDASHKVRRDWNITPENKELIGSYKIDLSGVSFLKFSVLPI